jgi:hypothetical protein
MASITLRNSLESQVQQQKEDVKATIAVEASPNLAKVKVRKQH